MKLLIENWKRYLKEERQTSFDFGRPKQQQTPNKRKDLYDNYYIIYEFDGTHSDKIEIPVCDDEIIGGTRKNVGGIYLFNQSGKKVMRFSIHKYSGWLGDLISAAKYCSGYSRYDCDDCIDDLKYEDLITDEFLDEDLYSGHWEVYDFNVEEKISRIQLAKLGISLREAALFLLQKEMGAKYYVFTDATHQGRSNEAAQKVVKILVKRGALDKPIDLSPSDVDEDMVNEYLIFPISSPKNVFKVQGSKK